MNLHVVFAGGYDQGTGKIDIRTVDHKPLDMHRRHTSADFQISRLDDGHAPVRGEEQAAIAGTVSVGGSLLIDFGRRQAVGLVDNPRL